MAMYIARVRSGRSVNSLNVFAQNEQEAIRMAGRSGKVIGVKRKFGFQTTFKLSRAERTIFLQRLASMVGSKVGIAESLKLISETFSGNTAKVAGEMRRRIEAGHSLVDSMEKIGQSAFPEQVVALVRTGSKGGDFSASLKEAVRFENEAAAVKKESGKGLWSAVGGFFAGVLTLFATTLYIVPEMEESPMMTAMDIGLPAWVMISSSIMTWMTFAVLAVSMFFLVLTKFLRPIFPVNVDKAIIQMPLVKDLVLARRNHVAFYGLGVLLKAGLRVEEALRLSRDNAERGQVRADFNNAHIAVRRGRPWPNEMSGLHATDRAALVTSQDRAQIADTMFSIANQYKEIYITRIGQFVPMVQLSAALFLTMSGAVMFGAVIIPMLQMTQAALAM